MQAPIPRRVGRAAETAVHFQEPVSFFMVKRVVEQGQWNRQNRTMETAVCQVHPLAARSSLKTTESLISVRTPD